MPLHVKTSPVMKSLAIILGAVLVVQPVTAKSFGTQPLQPPVVKPIPAGSARFTLPAPDPITVFTYKPSGYSNGPLLVVFHGVDRNAEEYRNHAICMAEKFKAIVVAPQFDAARFTSERYQRGGVLRNGKPQPQDQWTYTIVLRLVKLMRAREGRQDMPYYLIGHSAGGQFLARMAALLLTGGRVVDPASRLDAKTDVLISAGKIAAVGADAMNL